MTCLIDTYGDLRQFDSFITSIAENIRNASINSFFPYKKVWDRFKHNIQLLPIGQIKPIWDILYNEISEYYVHQLIVSSDPKAKLKNFQYIVHIFTIFVSSLKYIYYSSN